MVTHTHSNACNAYISVVMWCHMGTPQKTVCVCVRINFEVLNLSCHIRETHENIPQYTKTKCVGFLLHALNYRTRLVWCTFMKIKLILLQMDNQATMIGSVAVNVLREAVNYLRHCYVKGL